LKHGEGTYIFADGTIHKGAWQMDIRMGYGEMKDKDGKVLKGIWNGDKLVKKVEEKKVKE
jgi:hypothetical protein